MSGSPVERSSAHEDPPLALAGTVRAALLQARQLGLDRLDAQILLCKAMQQNRAWLISHDDAPLPLALAQSLLEQFKQLSAGVPLAYLLGEQEFHGLLLQVTPDTLVPRADTETLVDWALEILSALPGRPSVVDLGTGSGAIALAIKSSHLDARVEAVDLSTAALSVAQKNSEALGLEVMFHAGHWWQPLGERCFDLIVSNPPYIAAGDPHLPALSHEPISALTPGGDGLSDLLQIVQGAFAHLQPGGWLLLEHGYDQAEAVAAMFAAQGFVNLALRRDLGGQARVSGGQRPA